MLYGEGLFGNSAVADSRGALAEKFLIPPFSTLNAREGWWQARKRAWLSLGIKSEVGRGENALQLSDTSRATMLGIDYSDAVLFKAQGSLNEIMKQRARANGSASDENQYGIASGTSIFDPVLCELVYRWWCPEGGLIVDPFAGGSVRGVVAAKLGFTYMGVDLRPEQISANEKQRNDIISAREPKPQWFTGDSLLLDSVLPSGSEADFIFSCPPYGDLEKYSGDARDLSTMSYESFRDTYRAIIKKSCSVLKQDAFACFVVGDFRDKSGHYQNFVSDTIQAFLDAGCKLYNEAILLTAFGSLPIRTSRQFPSGRKLGKTHQNVLVFVKGSWKTACQNINGGQEVAPQLKKA